MKSGKKKAESRRKVQRFLFRRTSTLGYSSFTDTAAFFWLAWQNLERQTGTQMTSKSFVSSETLLFYVRYLPFSTAKRRHVAPSWTLFRRETEYSLPRPANRKVPTLSVPLIRSRGMKTAHERHARIVGYRNSPNETRRGEHYFLSAKNIPTRNNEISIPRRARDTHDRVHHP